MNQDEISTLEDDEPSKMQRKREDKALQALGARLTGLSRRQIDDFPVSEALRDALHEWSRIRSHEARRRHLKRIGKLVREHDVAALELAMDRVDPGSSLSMAATRSAQHWCERLLDEGNAAVTELVARYPEIDVQRLRQLLRKAGRGVPEAEGKPSLAQRDLLRFVRVQVVQSES